MSKFNMCMHMHEYLITCVHTISKIYTAFLNGVNLQHWYTNFIWGHTNWSWGLLGLWILYLWWRLIHIVFHKHYGYLACKIYIFLEIRFHFDPSRESQIIRCNNVLDKAYDLLFRQENLCSFDFLNILMIMKNLIIISHLICKLKTELFADPFA